MNNTPSAQAQLDDLAQGIIKSKVCPGLAKTATQLVMGEGNPKAEVMFIGEAPGKEEDLKGRPFVGAAGKFLDTMLAQVGLSRSEVYITNIVKYRPPANRDPQPEEIQAFMPWLIKQIKIIRPKMIATLGRFSTNVFLPQARISQDHGLPKRIRLIPPADVDKTDALSLVILPLYHPAAALYNGGMRQTLLDDFVKIPAVLKLINEQKSNKLNDLKTT